MLEVADVLRCYGPEYLDRFGQDLLPSHRRAIEDRLACRTEALGGQLLQCDRGGQEHDVYHSCRNRSCPKCHRLDTEAWLAERRQELLPVPYFHVVFTVPQELREISRRHHQDLYDILLRASALALIKLAADPHYVGGLIGVLCVLHTWTRTLAYHPHVHCLVPAGGVSADRTQWPPARRSYLVPVQALSQLFRGVFRALVHQERPDLTIPESVWTKGWVVYCKPALRGPEQVLNYLGRYVHRIALTNSRLLAIEDGHVCFRSQDTQDQRWKTMTLPALEFIRRFLQHVLPQGFHKVRYYGLWSPIHRPLLHQLQLWLAGHVPDPPPTSPPPENPSTASWAPPLRAGQPCPSCEQGLLVVIRSLPRPPRGPP
jgi:Putative transposase/Transposase zinc-binding domain